MANRILAYERIAAVASVPDWTASHEREEFTRTFEFQDADTVASFLADVWKLAADIGHEFEQQIDGYSVRIDLTTPEVGGLSELDVELAQAIDALVEESYQFRG